MSEQFANHAGTTLAAAITSTARPVTFSVASATGLPTSGNFRMIVGSEILLVTSISGTSLTGSNVEGTTAATYPIGQAATHVVTAGALAQVELDVVATMLGQANTFTAAQTTFDANILLATASVATSGANYAAAALQFGNSYWTGSAAGSDTWSLTPTLGTGSNPTSTLTLAHSGSTGTSTFSVQAATTINPAAIFVATFKSSGGAGTGVVIDSGAAGQSAAFYFADAGTYKWGFTKTAGNNWQVFDYLGNRNVLLAIGNGPLQLFSGTGNVLVGSTTDAGQKLQVNGSATTIALATPGAPTVTPTGTAGTTSYSYVVVANQSDGSHTIAGSTGGTSTGNATLSGTNYNALSWSVVTSAYSYTIYRTVGGATQGAISTAQTGTTLNDTGLAASGSAPTANTTGNLGIGTTARQQLSVGAYLDLYSNNTANSPAFNSIRAASTGIFINAPSSYGVTFNYDSGTGVNFGNGSGTVTASISAGGSASITGLWTGVRSVTANDTATTTDHSIILNGSSLTETLPASPANGQELYLVNLNASSVTVSGNGKNIWAAGTSASTYTLAATSAGILQYDNVNGIWRVIK